MLPYPGAAAGVVVGEHPSKSLHIAEHNRTDRLLIVEVDVELRLHSRAQGCQGYSTTIRAYAAFDYRRLVLASVSTSICFLLCVF